MKGLRCVDRERTHHQLVLVLSVHLRRDIQSEIDHKQELQLEAIHLRGWYASHLHRQTHSLGPLSGRDAHHSRELGEKGHTKASSYLGIIRVVVIYIVEELRRHHHAAVHKVSQKWSVVQGRL